jgi:hypothetical protein
MLPLAQPLSIANAEIYHRELRRNSAGIVESVDSAHFTPQFTPATLDGGLTHTEGEATSISTAPSHTTLFETTRLARVCIMCLCLALIVYLVVKNFSSEACYDKDSALAFLALTAALTGMLLAYLIINCASYSVQRFRDQWQRDQLHNEHPQETTTSSHVSVESVFA